MATAVLVTLCADNDSGDTAGRDTEQILTPFRSTILRCHNFKPSCVQMAVGLLLKRASGNFEEVLEQKYYSDDAYLESSGSSSQCVAKCVL